MNLFESVAKIKDIAQHALHAITTEEATKTALILPMLSALGYNIFNPYELIPEMDCDLSRGGDKVDYAISINGSIRIIIECKHHTCNLSAHVPQLMKYYAASEAKCGMLTNGIEYWFFSDTVKQNIMDKEPFFKFNILEMGNEVVEELHMFSKERFSNEAIQSYINETELRDKVIKSYRSNVTKMSNELVSLILKSAGVEPTQANQVLCREILAAHTTFNNTLYNIEELTLEEAIKKQLSSFIDESRIFSVKYKEHETIFMDNQSKWICRAYKSKGIIIFPPSTEKSTKDFTKASDISKYNDDLTSAVNLYL